MAQETNRPSKSSRSHPPPSRDGFEGKKDIIDKVCDRCPRIAQIAQADISRVLRAFRSLGIEAQVRIMTDGTVVVGPVAQDVPQSAAKCREEDEIRL